MGPAVSMSGGGGSMFAFSCCLGSLTLPGEMLLDSSNKFRGQLLGCWVAGGFGIVERQLIHFVFVIFHGYFDVIFYHFGCKAYSWQLWTGSWED